VISNIYLESWKRGLKGITIYRDGSRHPILSIDQKTSEFHQYKGVQFKAEVKGVEITARGDDVISMPDGSLTTIYHLKKAGFSVTPLESAPEAQIAKPAATEEVAQAEDVKLHKCVSCGKNTMKIENGCKTCIDKECGFSQCDI